MIDRRAASRPSPAIRYRTRTGAVEAGVGAGAGSAAAGARGVIRKAATMDRASVVAQAVSSATASA